MSKNKKENEDGSTLANLSTINDVQKFCSEMIANGKGDYRFVVDFNWKFSLLTSMKVREDSKSILLK